MLEDLDCRYHVERRALVFEVTITQDRYVLLSEELHNRSLLVTDDVTADGLAAEADQATRSTAEVEPARIAVQAHQGCDGPHNAAPLVPAHGSLEGLNIAKVVDERICTPARVIVERIDVIIVCERICDEGKSAPRTAPEEKPTRD